MSITPGYHGYNQTPTTNDTYETVFDVNDASGVDRIWGMEFECTGDNAQILLGPVSVYNGSPNPVTIIAGAPPRQFAITGVGQVQAKFATVAGSGLTWRTIGAG